MSLSFLDPLSLEGVFVMAVAASSLVALARWRAGIAAAIVIGVIQDPIRKLVPGAPPILAVSSAPVWIAAFLSAVIAHRPVLGRFVRAYPWIARYGFLLVLTLIPASLSVLRFGAGSWKVVALGLFNYLAPLTAGLVGVYYVRSLSSLKWLSTFYCSFIALVLLGTVLDFMKVFPEATVLGTRVLMGAEWIRSGANIGLTAGSFRSPELMSWHAATAVMLAMTMALLGRQRLVFLPAIVIGLLCLLIGGRRKMIAMPILWLWTQILGADSGSLRRRVTLLAAAGGAGLALAFVAGQIEVQANYHRFALSTASDAPDRLTSTFGGLVSSISRVGLIGGGVGLSTSARHLGVSRRTDSSSFEPQGSESGLTNIVHELGVLGLLFTLLLGVSVCYELLGQIRTSGPSVAAQLHKGVVGCCVSIFASFVISGQAYSDTTIMCVSGLLFGIALSGRHWSYRASRLVAQNGPS